MSGVLNKAAKVLLPKTGQIATQAFNGTSAALDVAASALGAAGLTRILRLQAAADCYIACGDSTVTVSSTTGLPVEANMPIEGYMPVDATHIAVIEAATGVGGTLTVAIVSP